MKSKSQLDPGEGPLVLVIDDFDDNRALYSEYLRFVGFRVAEAQNGKEAIDHAIRLLPDVIVMDLTLPVMDGFEATTHLKADPRTHAIPVIILTGHGPEEHSKRAKEAGCEAFLTKPCLPEVLLRKVNEMLAARHKGPKK